MVLSLSTICLISLRDRIRNSQFQLLPLLQPAERQKLLDFVLISSTIYQPFVLQSLSTPEFLSGMTSFSTQKGTIDDRKYLLAVAKSLAQSSPSGQTIGAGISNLELNIYGLDADGKEDYFMESNLKGVISIIGKCPKLKSLSLKLVGDYGMIGDAWHPVEYYATDFDQDGSDSSIFSVISAKSGLLSRNSVLKSCFSILKNVQSLSLTGFRGDHAVSAGFLANEHPVSQQFRNVSSLHLSKAIVDKTRWAEFLRSMQNQLTDLEVEWVVMVNFDSDDSEEAFNDDDDDSDSGGGDVGDGRNNDNNILPFSLPNLKSFKIDLLTKRTNRLMTNLSKCPNLQFVHLELSAYEDEELFWMIDDIKTDIDLKVVFDIWRSRYGCDHDIGLDYQSKFRFVDKFGSKIKELEFRIAHWNCRYTAALSDAIADCTNLIALHFRMKRDVNNRKQRRRFLIDDELQKELQSANEELAPLFFDIDRARKLQHLSLVGSIDHRILTSIFENCANLKSISILQCPELFDDHLIKWASIGAKPKEIRFRQCQSLTDHGLIPIVISSGEALKVFIAAGANHGRVINRTFLAVVQNCPNVVEVNLPKRIQELYGRRFFNNLVDYCHYRSGRRVKFGQKRFNLEKNRLDTYKDSFGGFF